MSAASVGLRQRKVGSLVEDTKVLEETPLLRRFAQADMFPKPKEDFARTQTEAGSLVSWLAAAFIVMLLVWEIGAYVLGRDAYHTELSVDGYVDSDVPFNIDITFPSIPCHELHIDTLDATGRHDADVLHDLFKSPVDRSGNTVFIGAFNYVQRKFAPDGQLLKKEAYDARKDPKSVNFCGDCYIPPNKHHTYDKPGGVVDEHLHTVHKDACCNTCESVMQMYDLHRLPRPPQREVEQCINELSRSNPGCNLRGVLTLKKVMGNFHFAPGVSQEVGPNGAHIHQYSLDELLRYNISHKINKFSIGNDKIARFSARGTKFPLEGQSFTVHQGLAHIKYFIKIVPTQYQIGARDDSSLISTSSTDENSLSFEYSAQFHHQGVGMGGQAPSIFFMFEFHPMMITNIFQRPHFGHFVVQLCGIIGGLFVVLGFVDQGVQALIRAKNVVSL
jgi:hypothetical protein